MFLKTLTASFRENSISYFICSELHEDGNPHIYVYLEFKSKKEISSKDKLHINIIDLSSKMIVCQRKYESAQDTNKVLQYTTKDPEAKYETNMSLPSLNRVFYWILEEHLCAVLDDSGFESATRLLVNKDTKLAIKKASSILKNLQLMGDIKDRERSEGLVAIRNLGEFTNVPPEVMEWMSVSQTKSLVLWGPNETGKTELTKCIIQKLGKKPLLIRDIHMLGVRNIRTDMGLIFDEISLQESSLKVKIHYFDMENETHLRVLYKVVRIPKRTVRIFTTNNWVRLLCNFNNNYVPEELKRRIEKINIEKFMVMSMKRTPTVTEEINISTIKDL